MSKRMLIDASHPEETRVVVLDGQRVEEFDFEAASKRPLKGNIYLAKVTRVEPSLQAAFVEYGGNRQGFLAFSEIHPDYYQIPVADRMALIAEAEAEARRRQEADVESFEITSGPKPSSSAENEDDVSLSAEEEPVDELPPHAEDVEPERALEQHTELSDHSAADESDESGDEEVFTNHPDHAENLSGLGQQPEDDVPLPDGTDAGNAPATAEEGGEDAGPTEQIIDPHATVDSSLEPGTPSEEPVARGASEIAVTTSADTTSVSAAEDDSSAARALHAPRPPQRWMRRRHYKIQEVIKRRQIILVQVVKEERGNKGAALTTYLSLAGRYCVLMPNTPRGGGISRKITSLEDRKRLKSAAQALELPEGMGLIIRTAGENRSKIEIRRDYEYLLRLWDTIRELTLKSNAPSCVYEEGDLIKRAIRDLYNKDLGEVLVEGEDGYRNAKEFMRMIMPSHAKNVRLYKEPVPLYQRFHIEPQLDAMFSPTVTLKSGGYIVINQTEALVSIDVNSGRATREHSIEETAHKTNLEAADEIGRQLRLRDLAGLIVIDFIDMEDSRNDRDVEKRLRDAVKNDRARVQIGKISQFGLLEMSRQRLRAGVIAGSTVPCPHCGGQGIIRSVESTALRVLRALEEEGQRLRAAAVVVHVADDVAIYTLNQKRKELARLESDYGMEIAFEPKPEMPAGTFDIQRTAQKSDEERARYAVSVEAGFAPPALGQDQDSDPTDDEVEDQIEQEEAQEDEAIAAPSMQAVPRNDIQGNGGRRRRRRRRGGRDRHHLEHPRDIHQDHSQHARANEVPPDSFRQSESAPTEEITDASPPSGHPHASLGGDLVGGRRRRRRRRRGRRGQGNGEQPNALPNNGTAVEPTPDQAWVDDRFGDGNEIDTTPREEPTRSVPNAASAPDWSLEPEKIPHAEGPQSNRTAHEPETSPASADKKSEQPAKRGWWQRAFRSE